MGPKAEAKSTSQSAASQVTRTGTFGPYLLEERLAVGGSAEIFLARPTQGSAPAARFVIKRLLPGLLEAGEGESLVQEAELHRAVNHPNVVRVLEAGIVHGEPYLALEFIEGLDLQKFQKTVRSNGRQLRPAVAVFVARRVAAALGAIHSARDSNGNRLQLVHGDVTPTNIYLGGSGDIKLGDFGAALTAHTESGAARELRGKIGYAAPELMLGHPADGRADQFALGVILGELLIGGPVFTGDGELARLLAMRDGDHLPLLNAADRIDSALLAIVVRALSPDPADRFDRCTDFATALEPFEIGTTKSDAADPERELRQFVSWARDVRRSGQWIGVNRPSGTQLRRPPAQSQDERHDERANRESAPPVTTGLLYGPDSPDLVLELTGDDPFDLFARLRRQQESGLVTFECSDRTRGKERVEAYVRKGRLVHVTCSDVGARLGRYLVRRGVLTPDQLAQSLDRALVESRRLSEVLMAQRLVSLGELERAVRIQARDRCASTCAWTHGTACFYRGAEPENVHILLDLDLAGIIMAGAIYATAGDPRSLLPDKSTKLSVGVRAGALVDPKERGRAPAALVRVAGLAARGATIGECIEQLTRGGTARAVAADQAAAIIVAARALAWISC